MLCTIQRQMQIESSRARSRPTDKRENLSAEPNDTMPAQATKRLE